MLDLRHLLKRSSVSPEQLAERTGLSLDRIQQLIAGQDASLRELREIASSLKLRLSDLIPEGSKYQRASMMFRTGLPEDQKIDDELVDWISRKIESSFDIIGSRNDWAPFWSHFFVVEEESYAAAEACAAAFREAFFGRDLLSPIVTLPEIAVHKMGVLLFVVNIPKMSGASAVIDGQPFVFVSSQFPPRMLYTLAHELGHLVAHFSDEGGFAILDQSNDDDQADMRFRKRMAEAFANAFASCLLLPAAGVGVALKKIREVGGVKGDQIGDIELLYLSRIFGTSFEVAARRCEDLKLLPRGGARALYQKLKLEYGSPEKRAERLNLPPRPDIEFPLVPERLVDSAVEKIRSGDVSIGRASSILGISISDILASHAQVRH